jgi:phosphoribosylformylglycinamidine cyclo-ligase
VQLSYISHITGHGLLKLMRPPRPFTYRIERLPEVPEVLGWLVEAARLEPAAAYSTFNMGAGLALYCTAGTGEQAVAVAADLGLPALLAGAVDEGDRQVLLEPLGVRFASEQLELSA